MDDNIRLYNLLDSEIPSSADNAGIAPGYDQRTSTGPTSGTLGLGHSGPFATTIGDFIVTQVNNSGATFTATVGTATGVPEPGSTLTLLVIGLAGLGIIRRRAASRGGSATSASCVEIVGIRFRSGLLAGGRWIRTFGSR
jgi:hypothetical protein